MDVRDIIKIAIDIGGVISKYPRLFKELIEICRGKIEVFIISDMHPVDKIHSMFLLNGITDVSGVYSADYSKYGENCKKILCEQLGIDILIDDFIGYVAEGNFIRLLVMPNPTLPYYADEWKTDGSEGEFGRRVASK